MTSLPADPSAVVTVAKIEIPSPVRDSSREIRKLT